MVIHLKEFLRILLVSNTKFKFDLGVVGLGYVGLPLAVEAASNGLKVIGYDINSERVEMINNGSSPIEDISNEELSKSLIDFHSTTESKELSQCKNIVISCLLYTSPSPRD